MGRHAQPGWRPVRAGPCRSFIRLPEIKAALRADIRKAIRKSALLILGSPMGLRADWSPCETKS